MSLAQVLLDPNFFLGRRPSCDLQRASEHNFDCTEAWVDAFICPWAGEVITLKLIALNADVILPLHRV